MRITILISLLCSVSYLALANYHPPGPAPAVSITQALEAAQAHMTKGHGPSDAYVDHTVLITVGSAEERVWIIWFASPSKGYTILEVDMDKKVRQAPRERIDQALGVRTAK
jgi:hypothetical protein